MIIIINIFISSSITNLQSVHYCECFEFKGYTGDMCSKPNCAGWPHTCSDHGDCQYIGGASTPGDGGELGGWYCSCNKGYKGVACHLLEHREREIYIVYSTECRDIDG